MARGELLAFTDDDRRPEPGWLTSRSTRRCRAQPDALAGGRQSNAIDSRFAEASQLLADFVCGVLPRRRQRTLLHVEQPRRVARSSSSTVGAFDTSFPFSAGEDRELCDRWSAQGRPSVRVEGASSGTSTRSRAALPPPALHLRPRRRGVRTEARVDGPSRQRWNRASTRSRSRTRGATRRAYAARCTLRSPCSPTPRTRRIAPESAPPPAPTWRMIASLRRFAPSVGVPPF